MKFYVKLEKDGTRLEVDEVGIRANMQDGKNEVSIDATWVDLGDMTRKALEAIDPATAAEFEKYLPPKVRPRLPTDSGNN
jgi:hypothetical protein